MAKLYGWGLTYHLRVDPENRTPKTLCGRTYDITSNLELAEVEEGKIRNAWRELDEDEICKKCLKSWKSKEHIEVKF